MLENVLSAHIGRFTEKVLGNIVHYTHDIGRGITTHWTGVSGRMLLLLLFVIGVALGSPVNLCGKSHTGFSF